MEISTKRQKALDYLKENRSRINADRNSCSNLTVLSFGGGQDSTAMIIQSINDFKFKRDFIGSDGKLIVVMSDTGDEHDYTYENVEVMRNLCRKNNIPFFFLEQGDAYHTGSWPNLIEPQQRPVGSKYKEVLTQLNTKSCTINLKINPIYKFLDHWINKEYEYGFKTYASGGCNKQAIQRFYKENGRIKILIGFASEEETRAMACRKSEFNDYNKKGSSWEKAIFREFPLIEMGMNRQDCQKYIAENGFKVPMPSNCMRCPYMSKAELLWLYRNSEEKFNEWVGMEQRKIERQIANPVYKKDKVTGEITDVLQDNNGVMNRSNYTLTDMLKEAVEQFGDLSDDELNSYKMNHGCDGNSNF